MRTPSFKQDMFTSNDKVKKRARDLSHDKRKLRQSKGIKADKPKRRKSSKQSKRSAKRDLTVSQKQGHGFYSSESENSLPPIKGRGRSSNLSQNKYKSEKSCKSLKKDC